VGKISLKSDFIKNVITLITGTTIAQAIPVALSPILTRIYTPEDFGVLALFISISAIFGSIATARYELAIMLPESDDDAINLTALGVLISLFLSLFIMLVVILFHSPIVQSLGNQSISIWLYIIPVLVFFTGVYNSLFYLNTRKEHFKNIAKAKIAQSIVTVSIQLLIHFIKSGALGLISGYISGYFTSIFYLFNKIRKETNYRKIIKLSTIKKMARRYVKFPKFSLWASLANTLSTNLIDIFISTTFSVATLGFYSLSKRVLGMPSALIGDAMGKVFFQKATKEKKDTGKSVKSFTVTLKYLIILGLPVFIILFFIIEDLFAFVFGEEWRVAGVYSKYLVFFYFFRFLMAPLSIINSIFEKQQISLIWQSGLLILILLLFLAATVFKYSMLQFLLYFTIVISIYYLLMIPVLYYISKGGKWKI